MAKALRLIEYPIRDWEQEAKSGWKDPILIPWIGQEKLTWITKDDAAKRAHIAEIKRAEISVVWVHGMGREKNHISVHQLHLMLTARLMPIADVLASSRAPIHHVLYCHGNADTPAIACHVLNEHLIDPKSSVRHARLK